MQDFKKLRAWQAAHQLSLDVYRLTATFPADERFGLTSQMRRAAVSISSNIAEGCGRGTSADLARFLHIAIGSSCELEAQLLIAHDLRLLSAEDFDSLLASVVATRRMLTGLLSSVRAAPVRSTEN